MAPNTVACGCVLALLSLTLGSLAAKHEYSDVVLHRDNLMFRRSGMYGPDDTPDNKGSSSFIKVDLTFARANPEFHGESMKVQLAVFDQKVWDAENVLGVMAPNKDGQVERIFCCTAELVKSGACDEPLTLILSQDISEGTYVHDIEFTAGTSSNTTSSVQVDRKFDIPFKGLKYLLISSCNDLTGDIIINGRTEWRNPYGYLPGELYGFLGFFSQLAMLYIVVAAVWAVACARHWRELMILQNYVTLALALSMMEMALRYFDFAQFNSRGTRGTGLMLASSILHTSKQTVSRLLVLVVSMGFGIVKPSLGDSFNTVGALGGLFFFFAIVQRIYELSSHTSSITFMQYVTMLPVAALDLVFFFWIFRSLTDIIGQLETREQGAKLMLYRRFRLILIFTMLIASGWSVAYTVIVVSGKITADWESRWLFDGFFDVLYFLILVAIMILWRPTNNSAQFAYSKVQNRDIDDAADEEYGNGLAEEAPLPQSPAKPAKSARPATSVVAADDATDNSFHSQGEAQEVVQEMRPIKKEKKAKD